VRGKQFNRTENKYDYPLEYTAIKMHISHVITDLFWHAWGGERYLQGVGWEARRQETTGKT